MSFSVIRRQLPVARLTGSRLSSPYHVSLPVFQLGALRSLPVSRTYASKTKAKSTASFVPGSQFLFDSEETRVEYAKAESKMTSAVDWFRKEVAGFETRASGRVTPALLSPVRVEARRGQTVKLEEVATIGIKDGSVLIVTVFDEHVRGAHFFSLPMLAHGYEVEYESGRASDIRGKITQHCPATARLADVQDTHTQVGAVPWHFLLPHAYARRLIGRRSKPEMRSSRRPPEWRKMCAFKSVNIIRLASERPSTKNTRSNSKRCDRRGSLSVVCDSLFCAKFQKLSDKHIAEVDKILVQMKKVTGSK